MYRDTLGTSLDMGVDALRALGMRGAQALRVVKAFRERDRESMGVLAEIYDGDRQVYISTARRHIQNFGNLFKADVARREGPLNLDRAWEGPPRTPEVADPESST